MINVALVGLGFAGRTFHWPLIRACPALRLHTVVTTRADAAAITHPGVLVTTAREAFAAPEVDLVVIATPNDTHAPLARDALKAGKAVVVDKPFTVSLAEAEELAALAEQLGRLLSVFHNRRWDSDFLTVKALIEEGRLGQVTRFESHFDRYRPTVQDRWRERPGAGSGIWYDLGPHLIDQALQLFGAPTGVFCDLAVQRDGATADDYFHAGLRYERLRVVLHADTLSAASSLRFSIHGDRGSFLKHGLDVQEDQLKAGLGPYDAGWGRDPSPGVLVDGPTGGETTVTSPAGDYPRYYSAVAAAIAHGGPNPVPPTEAVQVMRVLEAGVRSNTERREIPL